MHILTQSNKAAKYNSRVGGGHTRYPENYWDSFFVSPKCGKKMGLAGFPNSNPRGLDLK
jgi:hypothetical protein